MEMDTHRFIVLELGENLLTGDASHGSSSTSAKKPPDHLQILKNRTGSF
jgi:hypothetical protein